MTDIHDGKESEEIYLDVHETTRAVSAKYDIIKDIYSRETGKNIDSLSQALSEGEADKENSIWGSVGKVLDWVLTPLSAGGDAILAPIAHEYKEGEGIMTGAKVSASAFIKTLIPGWKDNEQPHYAREIVDRYMEGSSDLTKTTTTFGLDVLADPLIVLGFPGLKFLQKTLRIGAGSKLAKANKMPASMMDKLGSKFKGTIGTSEEAIIRMYEDAGSAMTPLAKELQKLGRIADTGKGEKAAGAYAKIIETIGTNEETMDLLKIQDLGEVQDFLKLMTTSLGTPDGKLISFEKKIDQKAFQKSLVSNKFPDENLPNFNLMLMTDEKAVHKGINEYWKVFEKEYNDGLKELSNPQKITMAASQEKQMGDMIKTPIKAVDAAGQYANRATVVALTKLMNGAAHMVQANDPLGAVLFRNYEALLGIFMGKTSGVARLWGSQTRTLGYAVEEVDVLKRFNQMQKMMLEAVDVDPKKYQATIAKFASATDDPSAIAGMVEARFTPKKGLDVLFEVFVNSILSSPLTSAINMTSTAFRMALEPLSSVGASVTALARLDGAEAMQHWRDVYHLTTGMMKGISEAFRLGTQKFSGGKIFGDFDYPIMIGPRGDLAKMKFQPSLRAENFGATGAAAKIINTLGFFTRIPGNALMGEDKFMKMISYRMKVNTYAAKMAREVGDNTQQRKDLFRAFSKHPSAALDKQAMHEADSMLFHSKLGPRGQKMDQVLKTLPGTRWVIPFFQTPTNLVHEGMRHTPFGAMYKDMRSVMFNASAEGDLVRAKLAMGPMMAGGLMAMMGENITGKIDTRSASGKFEAEQIRRPFTLTIGNFELAYDRIEPLKFIIGSFVTLRDIMTNIDMDDPGEEPIAKQAVNIMVGAFVGTALDNYMVQNVGQIFNLLNAATNSDVDLALETFADIAISMSSPQAVAQWEKQKNQYFMQADTALEKLRKRGVGTATSIYAHRNVYGEKIQVPHGWGPDILNPLYNNTWASTATDAYSPLRFRKHMIDPISQEIIDLKVPIKGQLKSIRGVKLLPAERDYANKIAGQGFGNKPVKDLLKDVMKGQNWETFPNHVKQKVISNIFNKYRSRATKLTIVNFPRIRKEIRMNMIAKKQGM